MVIIKHVYHQPFNRYNRNREPDSIDRTEGEDCDQGKAKLQSNI